MQKKLMGLPLPVWLGVAAAGLLLGLYLRHRSSQGTIASATAAPLSDPNAGLGSSTGDIGSAVSGGGVAPPSSGFDPTTMDNLLQGIASGFAQQSSSEQNLVDAIGSLVYSIPSSGGSGASAPGSDTSLPWISYDPYTTPTVKKKAPTPSKPKAPARAPAKFYTYKPGKAPAGKKAQQAPKAPKGKTLHYAKGKGYYYA